MGIIESIGAILAALAVLGAAASAWFARAWRNAVKERDRERHLKKQAQESMEHAQKIHQAAEEARDYAAAATQEAERKVVEEGDRGYFDTNR